MKTANLSTFIKRELSSLYVITVILAFCSIVYELLLAQALSAFLENTVLRYSVTIGLYMFSMGFGALLTEKRFLKDPVMSLLSVEVLLTVLGGFVIVFLHLFHMAGAGRLLFSVLAHAFIIAIGVLTGIEIPLLISIRNRTRPNSENIILGIDYFGALCGTAVFTFLFYPRMGLMPTAFAIGLLNAVAGVFLALQFHQPKTPNSGRFVMLAVVQMVFFTALIFCLVFAGGINDYLMAAYLKK